MADWEILAVCCPLVALLRDTDQSILHDAAAPVAYSHNVYFCQIVRVPRSLQAFVNCPVRPRACPLYSLQSVASRILGYPDASSLAFFFLLVASWCSANTLRPPGIVGTFRLVSGFAARFCTGQACSVTTDHLCCIN